MPSTWQADEPAIDPEFEDVPEKAERLPESTEKLAVVSLVAGITGFFFPVVGPVTAIVSGHVARDEIRKAKGRLGGDTLAKTGLILGYVWVGLTLVAMATAFVLIRTQFDGGPAMAQPLPSPHFDSHAFPEPMAFPGAQGQFGEGVIVAPHGGSEPGPAFAPLPEVGTHGGGRSAVRILRGTGIVPPALPEPEPAQAPEHPEPPAPPSRY